MTVPDVVRSSLCLHTQPDTIQYNAAVTILATIASRHASSTEMRSRRRRALENAKNTRFQWFRGWIASRLGRAATRKERSPEMSGYSQTDRYRDGDWTQPILTGDDALRFAREELRRRSTPTASSLASPSVSSSPASFTKLSTAGANALLTPPPFAPHHENAPLSLRWPRSWLVGPHHSPALS